MLKGSGILSRGLRRGSLALFAFLLIIVPGAARAPGQFFEGGALVGFVYDETGRKPITNAVVSIRNLENRREYRSHPSDMNGWYQISGIREGQYVLGVTDIVMGNFNFNYSMYLKEKEVARLSLSLKLHGREFDAPLLDGEALTFFASAAGVISVVLITEIVLYSVLSREEEEVSPVRR